MKTFRKTGAAAIAVALAIALQAPRILCADVPADQRSDVAQPSLAELASQAVAADPMICKPAIQKLRAAGPAGLDALLTASRSKIAAHRQGGIVMGPDAANAPWPRVTAALDAVAAQRNAYASGLYWYTDLPAAESAARASGKPILSLRLLGNLNDECSCANSRFFRTVLYANSEVSKYLREHFILHWQSVRPVPVITIDFGDGRVFRRTITGNSIHYVLTADGKVIDGIPGLYGPKAFLRVLGEDMQAVVATQRGGSDPRRNLVDWHLQQAKAIQDAYQADLKQIGLADAATATWALKATDAVYSIAADTKCGLEKGMARQMELKPAASPAVRAAEQETKIWGKIASLHREDAVLDTGSTALMAMQGPGAVQAGRLAMTKRAVEDPLVRMIGNFETDIAMDSVRNQYTFHLQIHRWLADPAQAGMVENADALNKRIYAELFLTPDSDPWLGLVPADTYSALDDGGVCH